MKYSYRTFFALALAASIALAHSPAPAAAGEGARFQKIKPIDRIKAQRVRSISHYVCDLASGRTYKSYHYEYDREARLVASMRYNPDGTLAEKTGYEHGDASNITGVQYDAAGAVSGRTTFKYDCNDNMIERAEHSADGRMTAKTVYVIGSSDDVVEETDYDAAGAAVSSWRSEYRTGPDGRIAEKITRRRDGSVESRDLYSYDASGNIVEKVIAAPLPAAGDRLSTVRQTYGYDRNANIVSVTNFAPDGRVVSSVKTVYSYYRP